MNFVEFWILFLVNWFVSEWILLLILALCWESSGVIYSGGVVSSTIGFFQFLIGPPDSAFISARWRWMLFNLSAIAPPLKWMSVPFHRSWAINKPIIPLKRLITKMNSWFPEADSHQLLPAPFPPIIYKYLTPLFGVDCCPDCSLRCSCKKISKKIRKSIGNCNQRWPPFSLI